MYCSQLLILKNVVSESVICKFQNYLAGLNGASRDLITTSKVSHAIGINIDMATRILLTCYKNGVLKISFGIRCPNCGLLIKKISDADSILGYQMQCYRDEEYFYVDKEDIIAIFEMGDLKLPFVKEQQDNSQNISPNHVAQEDSVVSIFGEMFQEIQSAYPDKDANEVFKLFLKRISEYRDKLKIQDKKTQTIIKIKARIWQGIFTFILLICVGIFLIGILLLCRFIYQSEEKLDNLSIIVGIIEITFIGFAIWLFNQILPHCKYSYHIEKQLEKI